MKNRCISLVLLLVGGMTACGRQVRPQAGQNIVLVTIDTLRADRLGCYGYAKAATPHMDQLATEGVLFEQAIAQVPVTLPSHASILTGTYPPVHGVRDNTYFRLDSEALTLAEHLRSDGYQTAAFVGAFVLDGSFGLNQGFDVYDDRIDTGDDTTPGAFAERPARDVVQAFNRWLRTLSQEKPFFAWVHLFDPHMPYAPPSPYRERFRSSPYDGEVAYTDEQIGVMLEGLGAEGLAENTLVVVVSDHGESLGEHGERSHGFFVYDATLKVPLIMKSPRSLPAGLRIGSQVRAVDLFPTLLELTGISVPDGIQGKSLVGMIKGDEAADLPAYGECYAPQLNFHWAPLVTIRQDGFKYIEAPRAELYDLSRDPGETENLLEKQPRRAARMKETLASLLESWPESVSARHQPDPETLAKLRSLGYVAGGRSAETDAALPDPKDRLPLWEKAELVVLSLNDGDYENASAQAKSILEEDPTNLLAMELLANAQQKLGRRDEAIALHHRILEIDSSRPLTHLTLGNLLWKEERLQEAEQAFLVALELDRRYVRAHQRLGELYLSQGKLEAARASFAEAISIDANGRNARLGLARSLRASEQIEEALSAYESLARDYSEDAAIVTEYAALLARQGRAQEAVDLLRAGPEHSQTHYALSMILRSSGRMPEALAELEQTLGLEPDFAPAHHDRGVILSRLGRMEEALPEFDAALELREDPATRNALGTALCRLDRCDEAIPHFEKAVELEPRFVEALDNLAAAYELAGRSSEAEAVRRRASRLQPKNPL